MLALLVPSICHASEAELRDAYAAYQVAADAGDLHAALPHAQRAYELGLELYGLESRNTGLLAYNFGSALYESRALRESIEVLELAGRAMRASTNGEETAELFDIQLQLASAYTDDPSSSWRTADDAAQQALEIATDIYGPDSQETGLALLQIAYNAIPQRGRRHTVPESINVHHIERRLSLVEPGPDRLWISAFSAIERTQELAIEVLRYDELSRAAEIFEGRVLDTYNAALFYGVQGYYAGLEFDLIGRSSNYELMIELLSQTQDVADNHIHLLWNWQNLQVGLQSGQYKNKEIDPQLQIQTLASYRQDGSALPLDTPYPDYPEGLDEDLVSASVRVAYRIDAQGRPFEISTIDSGEDISFSSAVEEAIGEWTFIPASHAGRPSASGPHTLVVAFEARRQTLMQSIDRLDASIGRMYEDELRRREWDIGHEN